MTNKRRRLTGQVVRVNMPKTIVVAVTSTKRHPIYGKVLRTTKRYLVHDERGEAQIGDLVRIVESRPISRRKRFTLETIERRGEGQLVAVDEVAGEAQP